MLVDMATEAYRFEFLARLYSPDKTFGIDLASVDCYLHRVRRTLGFHTLSMERSPLRVPTRNLSWNHISCRPGRPNNTAGAPERVGLRTPIRFFQTTLFIGRRTHGNSGDSTVMKPQQSLYALAVLALVAGLAACGGGGGGNPVSSIVPPVGATPTPINAPTPSAPTTNASGVVVNDANGTPLAGVPVKLMPWFGGALCLGLRDCRCKLSIHCHRRLPGNGLV